MRSIFVSTPCEMPMSIFSIQPCEMPRTIFNLQPVTELAAKITKSPTQNSSSLVAKHIALFNGLATPTISSQGFNDCTDDKIIEGSKWGWLLTENGSQQAPILDANKRFSHANSRANMEQSIKIAKFYNNLQESVSKELDKLPKDYVLKAVRSHNLKLVHSEPAACNDLPVIAPLAGWFSSGVPKAPPLKADANFHNSSTINKQIEDTIKSVRAAKKLATVASDALAAASSSASTSASVIISNAVQAQARAANQAKASHSRSI
jgi:hypothetical protein